MKNQIITFLLLFTFCVSYSQISSNNSKPHISVVVAPFSDNENGSYGKNTAYASDFYILDIDDSGASLNIPFDPKADYEKSKKKIDQKFEDELTQIAKQYSGKLIASLFLKDGAFDYESLFNKGLENLTEDQRAGFSTTMQGLETTARDRLVHPIIDSNFLFVISPGYDGKKTHIVWSVFKVSIANDEPNKEPNSKNRLDSFLNLYSNNPADIDSSEFPVELLSYGTLKENKLLGGLDAPENMDPVIRKAQKEVFELRKKSLILDDLKIAIGSKEGLKVDDLIISYRKVEDENGDFTLQRMGSDRVKKVGNNDIDLIANPEAKAERTQLYADGRRVSRQGYIALEQKELALGVSAGINLGDNPIPYVKLDYRLARLFNETKLRNTFIILEAEFLTDLNIYGFDADAVTIVNAGLQKTFNLGRKFNVSVFGLYSVSAAAGSASGGGEAVELDIKQIKAGVSFAIKFGSLQIIPHITYALEDPENATDFSLESNFYGSSVLVGAGLRWNF